MKIFIKVLVTIFKLLFCLCITLTCIYAAFVINACAAHEDLQVVFYILVSLFCSVGIWVVAFAQINKRIRMALWVLLLLYFILPHFLPSIQRAFELDSCLDKGSRWDYAHQRCER